MSFSYVADTATQVWHQSIVFLFLQARSRGAGGVSLRTCMFILPAAFISADKHYTRSGKEPRRIGPTLPCALDHMAMHQQDTTVQLILTCDFVVFSTHPEIYLYLSTKAATAAAMAPTGTVGRSPSFHRDIFQSDHRRSGGLHRSVTKDTPCFQVRYSGGWCQIIEDLLNPYNLSSSYIVFAPCPYKHSAQENLNFRGTPFIK